MCYRTLIFILDHFPCVLALCNLTPCLLWCKILLPLPVGLDRFYCIRFLMHDPRFDLYTKVKDSVQLRKFDTVLHKHSTEI
mgnify:CR=1 FL=1